MITPTTQARGTDTVDPFVVCPLGYPQRLLADERCAGRAALGGNSMGKTVWVVCKKFCKRGRSLQTHNNSISDSKHKEDA